jgi:hypothetical protein
MVLRVHGGSVGISSTSTASTTLDRGDDKFAGRICVAWESAHIRRDGNKLIRSERVMERKRNYGWKCCLGNDHGQWNLYGTGDIAFARDGADYGNEPCGSDEISKRFADRNQRYSAEPNTSFHERGIGRGSIICGRSGKQRASG